ncbi:MAG: hypothetical protein KJ725_15175 [Gammaproteobacteria bacterium]|nr:hypothetical protein [Gammaproteobacteria bacterium]
MLPDLTSIQPTFVGFNFRNTVAAEQNPNASENDTQIQGRDTSLADDAQFSIEEQRQIEALKARDAEVRAHEQAHINAAAGIAVSGASFSYQTGPDGNRYAIGGEVQIDTSPAPGDPEATLRKAESIRRAALAPAQPSAQDFSVAANAARMASDARIELLKQTQENAGPQFGTAIDIAV